MEFKVNNYEDQEKQYNRKWLVGKRNGNIWYINFDIAYNGVSIYAV